MRAISSPKNCTLALLSSDSNPNGSILLSGGLSLMSLATSRFSFCSLHVFFPTLTYTKNKRKQTQKFLKHLNSYCIKPPTLEEDRGHFHAAVTDVLQHCTWAASLHLVSNTCPITCIQSNIKTSTSKVVCQSLKKLVKI